MWINFAQVLLFLTFGIAFYAANMALSRLIRPNNPGGQKATSYECGEQALGDSFIQFNSRFYLVALDFLIFDVEIVLLFPWAVSMKASGWPAFWAFVPFLFILSLGLAYVWVKGGLEWVRSVSGTLHADSRPVDEGIGPLPEIHGLERAA